MPLQHVMWREILLDLVLVGALVQAGGIAADDLSVSGLARTTLVVLLLSWHWFSSTRVHRGGDSSLDTVLLAVQVIALLVVAVTVPTAATKSTADAFVWAFVVATLALLAAYRRLDLYLVTGLLGVVVLGASTLLTGTKQQALWGLALVVSLAGARKLGADLGIGMLERYALGTILLFGASGLGAVVTLSGQGFSGSTVAVTVTLGLVIVSLWLLHLPTAAAPLRESPAAAYVWGLARLALVLGLVILPAAGGRMGLVELDLPLPDAALLGLGAALALTLIGVALVRLVAVGPARAPGLVAGGGGLLAGGMALAGFVGVDANLGGCLLLTAVLVLVPAATAMVNGERANI